MSDVTKDEKKILKRITDSQLSKSLLLIHEAMEHIWTNEVRIVTGFTDHGIEHCGRVAYFAEKLLRVSPKMKFCQNEIYLLLAGIYLHDIGMQCDIVNYPEVKKKAEELGAKFKEKFVSKAENNSYTQEQQNDIRENHHYLSAAYINYLYSGNNVPVLNNLIKEIPPEYVEDLMNVCMFHSKLNIDDCATSFRHDPTSRKKMVAAILRFADELDITSKRVEIETPQIYPMNPNDAMYWWLHDRTRVDFVSSNKIRLTVILHPEDFDKCGPLLREKYIYKFKEKNQSVLDVLIDSNINVSIDNESDVKKDEYFDRLDPDIISALINHFSHKSRHIATYDVESQNIIETTIVNNLSNDTSHLKTYVKNYQNTIYRYDGEGFLRSEDGTELPCVFELSQSESGEITLICNCSTLDLDIQRYFPELNIEKTTPVELKLLMAWSVYSPDNIFNQLSKFSKLSGVTSEGWNITGEIGTYVTTDAESLLDNTHLVRFEYYVEKLTVNKNVKENPKYMTFGVTNFTFTGNEVLALDIDGVERLIIKRKKEYNDILNNLENGIRVTSEISVEIDNEAEIKKSEDIANDLCELMSIALGTRVEWIYYDVYNTEGHITSRKHESRVTRPYQPMQLIRNNYRWLKRFLEESYVTFVNRPELLKNNKHIINAYLDSKKQSDYLEQRGIKIAVVIGLLLHLKPEPECIIDKKEFNMLKSELSKVLTQAIEQTVDSSIRGKICKNAYRYISCINRIPFQDRLSDFCESIDLKEDNLQSIIDSRGKLIQDGEFICQAYKDTDKLVQEYPNFKDPWSEYAYSLNFINKCILRLLGYEGPYINPMNFEEESF